MSCPTTKSLKHAMLSPRRWMPRRGTSEPAQHDSVLLFAASVTSAAAASIGQVIELSGRVSRDEDTTTFMQSTTADEAHVLENEASAKEIASEQKPRLPSITLTPAAPSDSSTASLAQSSAIMPLGIHTRTRYASKLPMPARGHAMLHKRSIEGSPYCHHHGTACTVKKTSRITTFVAKLTRLDEVDEEVEQKGLEVVKPVRRRG